MNVNKKYIIASVIVIIFMILPGIYYVSNRVSDADEKLAEQKMNEIEKIYDEIYDDSDDVMLYMTIRIAKKGLSESDVKNVQDSCENITELYEQINNDDVELIKKCANWNKNESAIEHIDSLVLTCERASKYYNRVSEMLDDGVMDDVEDEEYLELQDSVWNEPETQTEKEIQKELDEKYGVISGR